MKKLIAALILSTGLIGCASHYGAQSNFYELKEGMTRAQADSLLGAPVEGRIDGNTEIETLTYRHYTRTDAWQPNYYSVDFKDGRVVAWKQVGNRREIASQ